MSQELCKLRRDLLKQDPAQYAQLVSAPQFICMGCGRAANASQNLCEPAPIAQPRRARGPSSLIQEILALRQATSSN